MKQQIQINWQVTVLLRVSTLLYHLQGARNQYFAKLHKYVNAEFSDTI